jgi:hypothetical protein
MCKDFLAQNQDNMTDRRNMFTHGLLCQWPMYKDTIKSVGLVQSELHHHLIDCNLFSPWSSSVIAFYGIEVQQ